MNWLILALAKHMLARRLKRMGGTLLGITAFKGATTLGMVKDIHKHLDVVEKEERS